jgi:hypothetical protein
MPYQTPKIHTTISNRRKTLHAPWLQKCLDNNALRRLIPPNYDPMMLITTARKQEKKQLAK